MTVWTQVSEADIPRLRLGMRAYFTTLGRPDHRWNGRLRQKSFRHPSRKQCRPLYRAVRRRNPNQELMAQMTAQVSFVVAEAKEAVLVPVNAVGRNGGKQTISVQKDRWKPGGQGRSKPEFQIVSRSKYAEA